MNGPTEAAEPRGDGTRPFLLSLSGPGSLVRGAAAPFVVFCERRRRRRVKQPFKRARLFFEEAQEKKKKKREGAGRK